MNKIVQFIKESYAEFKKVIWPSGADVSSSTKIVIISVFIMAGFLGLLDIVLLRVLNYIF